ncbi:SUKH-4 family immunity protein [Haloferula sp. BvORR071]|uniref:SUKH-4 family immunity protein n=1 Tax=Haloferula sp. BvORR071 TaxID=1396141 RepID=UPI002240F8DB|nr:SUKH-4 family immunity protein [Haloferula sp. BvORR071]
MTAHEFKSRWEAVVERKREMAEAAGVPEVADEIILVPAPREILDVPAFPAEAARFLVEAGLPGSCAPFLSFEAVARGPSSLVQLYGAHQFSPEDQSRLASFCVIGSDGAGNPLCLDSARDGEIVMLDHEDQFRSRTFVASSVATLAHALLISYILPHAEFAEHVRVFDPRAADRSSFLPTELGVP